MVLITFNEYLQGVSRSLIKSPLYITGTLIVILILFIIVALIYKVYNYKDKKNYLLILKDKYENYIKKYNITNEEEKIIERLSFFLKNPEKKFLLLINPNIFHSALNSLRKTDHIKDSILKSILAKLKFNNISPNISLKTTYDMPDGMPVYVVLNSNYKISGKIVKSEDYLIVVIKNKYLKNEIKIPATIYTYNHSGIYSFSTKLINHKGNILYFKHSNKLKLLQRRRYFRKNLNLPVIVGKTHDYKPQSLIILNMSANGAALYNSDLKFKLGDDLRICFPEMEESIHCLYANVVRTVKDQSIIFVKFIHLNPNIQDKIVRLINVKKNYNFRK